MGGVTHCWHAALTRVGAGLVASSSRIGRVKAWSRPPMVPHNVWASRRERLAALFRSPSRAARPHHEHAGSRRSARPRHARVPLAACARRAVWLPGCLCTASCLAAWLPVHGEHARPQAALLATAPAPDACSAARLRRGLPAAQPRRPRPRRRQTKQSVCLRSFCVRTRQGIRDALDQPPARRTSHSDPAPRPHVDAAEPPKRW